MMRASATTGASPTSDAPLLSAGTTFAIWYHTHVALNIKDPETEVLAAEVAQLAGESKARAIKVALQERRERLRRQGSRTRSESLQSFLEEEVWPLMPPDQLGRRLTRQEEDAILGYGPEGY